MKKENAEVLTVRIMPEDKEALEKYAAGRHVTVSEAVRRFVKKGLELDGYSQDETKIRGYIRDELETILEPKIDRVIRILLKSSRASLALLYANAANLSDYYADNISFENVLAGAFANAAKYLKLRDEPIEMYLKEAKELNMAASGLKENNFDT